MLPALLAERHHPALRIAQHDALTLTAAAYWVQVKDGKLRRCPVAAAVSPRPRLAARSIVRTPPGEECRPGCAGGDRMSRVRPGTLQG